MKRYVLLNYANHVRREVHFALVGIDSQYSTIEQYRDEARHIVAALHGVKTDEIEALNYQVCDSLEFINTLR